MIPKGKEKVTVSVQGMEIILELESKLENVKEAFLAAYDKRKKVCLGKQEVSGIDGDCVRIHLSEKLYTALKSSENFRYARVCLELNGDNGRSCFLLEKKDFRKEGFCERFRYIGIVGCFSAEDNLVLYVSEDGLLSIKFFKSKKETQKNFECIAGINRVLQTRSRILSKQDFATESVPVYEYSISDDDIVVTHKFDAEKYQEEQRVSFVDLYYKKPIKIPMLVMPQEQERILWIYALSEEEFAKTGEYRENTAGSGVICGYTNSNEDCIRVMLFPDMEQLYKRYIHFQCENANVEINKKTLIVEFDGVLYSKKKMDFTLKTAELVVDDNHRFDTRIELRENPDASEKVHLQVPLSSIISQETAINNSIHIEAVIDDVKCSYNVGLRTENKELTKFNYVPSSAAFVGDWVLFVRKSMNQNFVLVVRRKDSQEKTLRFKILESRIVSSWMYHLGKKWKEHPGKNVNLYYEKNSMKADEGAFEVFLKAQNSKQSKNYFILDKHSDAWKRLSKEKHVVAKYSLRYYWLLYTSDYFISTETSSHLNIHRAMNYYVRTAILEKPLIFLQHGVTYLKRQGKTSVFGRGKEGEPYYIVVGSKKEADVVADMLDIDEERCVNTGLPIFSTIEYEHIKEDSEDIVTVMFTWRISEEHLLSHFEDSMYYQYTKKVYEMLQGFVPDEKIRIVPHPKVLDLLSTTDLSDRIWKGTVAEALRETKLLVTDYSSVCYNAFYQGAAVVFYQPDLTAYEQEVGKLIPQEDEYIGWRVFREKELEDVFSEGIVDGKINFSYLRTREFKKRYEEINQFSDGKNVDRIVNFLINKNII